jgi:hypothetical protein
MSDTKRLDAIEEAVAALLAERYGIGGVSFDTVDTSDLHREVKRAAPGLVASAAERVSERVLDATARVQFTGRNVAAIQEFVGDAASVSTTGSTCWIVQAGRSMRVAPGAWLAIDPSTNEIFTTATEVSV